MAEIPPEAVRAGAEALSRRLFSGLPEHGTWLENDEDLARAAIEAAAPIIADHALRTATREQHEEMIHRVTEDAINQAKPGLLALMEQQADQAITQRTEAIQAAERGPLLALIRDLMDAEECWYDHHGGCQAHGWGASEGRCPHARARELLDGEAGHV